MKRGGEMLMKRKRKNNIFSLFLIFVLIFSLTSSSLVMADTLDSDEQMDVIEEEQLMKGENPALEETDEEAPLENPTVEETPILNESNKENPLSEKLMNEETLGEQVQEKLDEKDNIVKIVEQDNNTDELKEAVGDMILESDNKDESISMFNASTILPMSTDNTIPVKNYLKATGTSTNNHYTVVGVYIDMNDNVHVIIDNVKKTANQVRFHSPKLNEEEALGFDLEAEPNGKPDPNKEYYDQYWNEIDTSLKLEFQDTDKTIISVTGKRLFDFNFGQMLEHVKATNTLQILNDADGFSIRDISFDLNLQHKIVKDVNKPLATRGDELIYTITIKNTGEFPLSGINVYDDEPDGITILGISENNLAWGDPGWATPSEDIKLENGKNITIVTVATKLALDKETSKTYYIKAVVDEDVTDNKVITNTAFTGGSVPREQDTANVTIELKTDVTIKKLITGNFGDLSRAFSFTVAIKDGSQESFELSHEGTHTIKDLSSSDVITLTEASNGYEVTVMIGETKIIPDGNDEYTIDLSEHGTDITITITNHKEIPINTGVFTGTLPYIIILTFTIVALSAIIILRKKYELDNAGE